ncbi:FAD-dependent oxidoreductase [Brevibacterium samyangense]
MTSFIDLTPVGSDAPACGPGSDSACCDPAEAPLAAGLVTGPVAQPVGTGRLSTLPVAVIGAGPIGLAAAAHLHARGIDFVVLEKRDTPGAAVADWGHTRLFSPWEHLVDPVTKDLLEAAGWTHPKESRAPYGKELVEQYVTPLAELPVLAAHIRTGVEVLAVTREGMDRSRSRGRAEAPFVVRLRGASGEVRDETFRAVIDASGTWANPNPLGSNGLEPLGLDAVRDRIVPALPDVLGSDRARFAGKHVTVVGAGHSAANTLIALAGLARSEEGTRVSWLIRSPKAVRVTTAEDELEGRGALGSRVDELVVSGRIDLVPSFEIVAAEESPSGGVRLVGRDASGVSGGAVGEGGSGGGAAGGGAAESRVHDTDVVVVSTGFRPDLDMLRELRLDLDEVVEAPRALADMIDPNEHSCGTVSPHGFKELAHPEPGFFIVGMKSYGRAPTFLLKTGYEQVRSVVAWLAGDVESASRVELVLPETGVCSTVEGGCC